MSELASAPRCDAVVRLGDADRGDLERLLELDPIANAMPAARVLAARSLQPARLGAVVYGLRDGPVLRGAVVNGGNLVPVGGDPGAWSALGAYLAGTRRQCTSIVGPAAAVRALWQALEPAWGPSRAIRARQPLLVRGDAAGLTDDGRVRTLRPDEIEQYLPAAAAMFTEELGTSPTTTGGGLAYRRRAEHLLASGRVFGIVDAHGEIVFKADIGAITRWTCQIQGVWVRREDRGRGIGTAAMAGVLRRALDLAPTVSLYVNDFNIPARRLYERLGMRQVGELSTVLY